MGWAGWRGGALIGSKSWKVQPKKKKTTTKLFWLRYKYICLNVQHVSDAKKGLLQYQYIKMGYGASCTEQKGIIKKENIYNTQQQKVHCNTAVQRHIYATSFTWVPLYLNTLSKKKSFHGFDSSRPSGHHRLSMPEPYSGECDYSSFGRDLV